jgi:hypothetical protein
MTTRQATKIAKKKKNLNVVSAIYFLYLMRLIGFIYNKYYYQH